MSGLVPGRWPSRAKIKLSEGTMTKLKSSVDSALQPAHLLLLFMILFSAFAVIFNSYQSRQLFHELQTLQQEVGSLHHEWRQLLVEEGAFSAHGRVEERAAQELGMQAPPADKTVAVRLK